MKSQKNIAGGLAGAVAVSAIHETIRRITPQAPRMDLLGMQALSRIISAGKHTPPTGKNLFLLALAGDLVSNTIYYSLAGKGKPKNVWVRGAILGAAAGAGAILLPKPLGLREEYSNRSVKTKILTFGLYFLGGIITAAASNKLNSKNHS